MIDQLETLRLLVIDDHPTWQEHIPNGLKISCKSENISAQIVIADTTNAAINSIKNHLFHGISIDQHMPAEIGGETSNDKGRQFLIDFGRLEQPSFSCVYTLHPDYDISNLSGAVSKIPYKIKSVESSGEDDAFRRMDIPSYSNFLVKQILEKYISNVFTLIEKSGFRWLHNFAWEARVSYEKFQNEAFGTDESAGDFFHDFGKFREHFNIAFLAFTYGIAGSRTDKLPKLPNLKNSKSVENWIKRTWDMMEESDVYQQEVKSVRDYIMISEEVSFSNYFVAASSELRAPRNAATHQDWRFTPENYMTHRGAFFRYMDIVAFVAKLPLVAQPRKTRNDILSYTEINGSRPRNEEIVYQSSIPETKINRLFALLPNLNRLISLDGGMSIDRDATTNRLKLVLDVID